MMTELFAYQHFLKCPVKLYNIRINSNYTVTLYIKPFYIMHYKSSFNALIMTCNAPYNAWFL